MSISELFLDPMVVQAGARLSGLFEREPNAEVSLPLADATSDGKWFGDVPVPAWPTALGAETLDAFAAAGLLDRVGSGRYRQSKLGAEVIPAFRLYNYCDRESLANRFPQLVTGIRGRRVLDAGCGYGAYAWYLAAQGARSLVAVDYSTDRLAVARLIAGSKRGVCLLRGSIEGLPLADASVDFVFCRVVLSFVHHARTIAEFARVLAPGGSACLMVHSPTYYWQVIGRVLRGRSEWKDLPRAALALARGASFDLFHVEPRLRVRGYEFKMAYERESSLRWLLNQHGLELESWERGAVKPYVWIRKPDRNLHPQRSPMGRSSMIGAE